jgi:glycerol-3-phosphate dehydrogenase
LFLDARSSIQAAPNVARMMARELGRDGDWVEREIRAFEALARDYLPSDVRDG